MTPSDRPLTARQWMHLAVILAAALALRLVNLDSNPPGSWPDEDSNGYDAWCLWHTGRDRHGDRWPLYFKSFNLYDQELYRYVCLAAEALLGPTRVAVRLGAVLAGLAAVALTFGVGRRLWGYGVGLAAAGLLAVSPWHLRYSRYGHSVILMPLALLLIVWLYRRWLDQPRRWALPLAVAAAGSLYTYAIAKLMTPFLLLTLAAVFPRPTIQAIRRWPVLSLSAGGVLVALALPLAAFNLTRAGTEQLVGMSVFGPAGQGVAAWWRNYVDHYRPAALFWEGAPDAPMAIPGIGFLHYFEIPTVLVGLAWLLRRRGPAEWLLLLWLAWYPAGSAVMGPVDFRRALAGAPAAALVSGLGLVVGWQWLARRRWGAWTLGILTVGAGVNLGYFGHQLLAVYPVETAPLWRYGYREAVTLLETQGRDGPRVWVDGDLLYLPHIAIAFYGRIDPRLFQEAPVQVDRATMRDYGTIGRYRIVSSKEARRRLRSDPQDAFWLGLLPGLPSTPADPGQEAVYCLPDGRPSHVVWLPRRRP